jgi:hypothetical protein
MIVISDDEEFYQYIKNNEKVICIEFLRDLLESGSCPTLH